MATLADSVTPARITGMAILAAAGLVLFLAPGPITPAMAPAAALVVFAIGFWATGLMPEMLVSLCFFLLAMILGAGPPEVVFSGFASGAFWLVFGGMIIGAAVDRTGLGGRLAHRIIASVGREYGTVILGIVLISLVLIFLMPSTLGRIVLLMPVVLALADRLGHGEGSPGRNGMVLAMIFSSYLCSVAVLPANVPNNVLVGAAETSYGVPIRYFDYLVLHFPVLGGLKAVVIWAVCTWMFRRPAPVVSEEARGAAPVAEQAGPPAYLSSDERRLSMLLVAALVLWCTDALHGVAPAWISLGVGITMLLPLVALVPPAAFKDKVNMAPLIYVAGILGVGALVAESGLGALISRLMLGLLPLNPETPFASFLEIQSVAMVLGIVATMPGVPAILAPIAGDMAAASGLPLENVLMMIVVGFSTVWFPYQVPPVVVGLQLARVPLGPAYRMSVVTAVVSLGVLVPLDALWWMALGRLPW
jgi:anion transporter